MKKLLFILSLLLFINALGQNNDTYSQDTLFISKQFDSLQLQPTYRMNEIKSVRKILKSTFNKLLFNERFRDNHYYNQEVSAFNLSQNIIKIAPEGRSYSEVEKYKNRVDGLLLSWIIEEKGKATSEYYNKNKEIREKKAQARLSDFLDNTDIPISEINKLTTEEKLKKILEFEEKKYGFTAEIIELAEKLKPEQIKYLTSIGLSEDCDLWQDKDILESFNGMGVFEKDEVLDRYMILTDKGRILKKYLHRTK